MNQVELIFEQLSGWLQAGGFVVFFLALFAGIALNYFGYRLHKLMIFLAGAVWFGLLALAALQFSGASQTDTVLGTLLAFFIGGSIALAMHMSAIFGLGMLVGGAVGYFLLEAREGWALVIMALLGGGLALAVYQVTIIVASSISGSWIMTWSSMGLANTLFNQSVSGLPGNAISRAGQAINSQSLSPLMSLGIGTLLLFLLFFLSGLAVQFGMHNKLPNLKNSAIPAGNSEQTYSNSTPYEYFNENLPEVRKQVYISIYQNGQLLGTHSLHNDLDYSLGRDAANSISVSDPKVSRQHLTIRTINGSAASFTDHNSSSGTWWQGETKIDGGTVYDNDWLVIGDTQLLFHCEPEGSFS